ncbi:MAG: hypothetical protein IJ068_06700 [Bacilli bacterium]|nr:hypothetical protein [Bacilli bacterium]
MEFDVRLYDSVSNGGLGRCHLLKKKNGGCMNIKMVYLFYSQDNSQHFIVCEGICGDKDYCSFDYAVYFSSLDAAIKYFDKLK